MKDSEQSLSGGYEAVFGAATVALRLSYEFLTTRLTMHPEKHRVTSTMWMARCHFPLEERLNYERVISTVLPTGPAFNHFIIFRRRSRPDQSQIAPREIDGRRGV